MSGVDPLLLVEASVLPDDDALLAADPTGAWGALVRLREEALQTAAPVAPVPDLDAIARWSADAADPDDDAVRFYAERSLLIAELLEGTLEALVDDAPRALAAAPARAATDPWPARYAGGGWTVVLGIDEAGWLYYSVDDAPEGASGDGELSLPDLDLLVPTALAAGTAGGLGDADDLLGGHDLNPVRSIDLAGRTLTRIDR